MDSNYTDKTFEKRVEIQMAKAGIRTRMELCEKLEISDSSLRRIYQRDDCKKSLLIKMCDIMNCTLNDLIGR